ncbi:unnamed protein product [marine sediment metagenome]|uniref:Uncharacterized protein n=1 Tax=marine sediment metagenome TaxID=412755 RepID=X1APJ5_9ZZZZ
MKRKSTLKSVIKGKDRDLVIVWRRNKLLDAMAKQFAKLTGQKLTR